MIKIFGAVALSVLAVSSNGQACTGECAMKAVLSEKMLKKMEQKQARSAAREPLMEVGLDVSSRRAASPCVDGLAGEYPCNGIDLLSRTPVSALGGPECNDIWGWADPQTGREYALSGLTNGVRFVDVTDPVNPVLLGFMRATGGVTSIWRDIKVFQNTAYVVADSAGSHGVQVFDLTRLRSNPTGNVSPDFTYTNIGSAHNIFINEDSGYAYVVGSRASCSGGLHLMNLNNNRLAPTFAGCFSADGYTHDVQCVNYNGPDSNFQGSEICFAYNEDTLTIIDVTDKTLASNNALANAQQLARVSYPGVEYTHQGWVTEDQRFLLLDDELDEGSNTRTRTYLFDVSSLTNPQYLRVSQSPVVSIDHNLYVKGDLAYMSNYASGLRVNSVDGLYNGQALTEVAYFDTYPASDGATFVGLWSSYIYLPSGNLLLNSIEHGLFVVKMSDGTQPPSSPTAPTPLPTSPPSEAVWTCPAAWLDGSDGCDCECGLYDPDCDTQEGTLYCDGSRAGSGVVCDYETDTCVSSSGRPINLVGAPRKPDSVLVQTSDSAASIGMIAGVVAGVVALAVLATGLIVRSRRSAPQEQEAGSDMMITSNPKFQQI